MKFPRLEVRRLKVIIVQGLAVWVTVLGVTPGELHAADISGRWAGAFARLGAIQTVSMDLAQTDSGWSGTYEIPEMILYREPIRELSVIGDTVSFRVFWGGFSCIIHDDTGEITGVNPKWGPPVSIHLKRTGEISGVRVEPVRFRSGPLELAGDLLIPAGRPPFPVVVVIEGSTTDGRSLWTYRSIGDLFARHGIAALLYDKRGTGLSEGDFASATFEDLANDVVQAVEYLHTRKDIDPTKIGLFGISQGGWIAPYAATKRPDVSSVMLLSGPAVSIWDQELQRVEYSMRAGILGEDEPDQFSDADIDAALAHTRLGFDVAQDTSRGSEWSASVDRARRSRWAGYVDTVSTVDDLRDWLRYQYDPAETLRHLNTPVLALFGGADVLVPPSENADRMRALLRDAGNDEVEIVVFPGVGHDYFTGASLVGDAWDWPAGFWRWNRRAPGLADTIMAWSRRHLGQ